MKLSNSQVKTLIQVYEMIDNAMQYKIPINDISNTQTIKRFQKILNIIIDERIDENQDIIKYLYLKGRKLNEQ